MFDACEWLGEVTEAAKLVESERRWLDAQRMMALRIGSPSMTTIHTGIGDPMAQIDALMDSENVRTKNISLALSEVEAARSVFSGMRSVGSMEHQAASILELVHIGLMTKKDSAESLGISYSAAKRAYQYGVDWLNAHGVAYAKAGKGLAT